jgi:ferric-dicitrate binding protein FerR (iron transport regulator)
MIRFAFRMVTLSALAALAFAASPVATISSAGTFELHGAAVKTEGIPSWPVMGGDDIRTGASPATVQFLDGSTVVLSEQSLARVEAFGNNLQFRLLSGVMQVNAAKDSAIKYSNNGKPVAAKSGAPVTVTTGPSKPGRIGGIAPSIVKPPPISGK